VKAFRLVEPTRTALVDVDVPAPRAGEVLLQVGSASFCHSDVALAAMPTPFFPVPVTMGHEVTGTVVGVGAGVENWGAGDEVAVHIIQGCGRCVWCLRGQDNRCLVGSTTPGVHVDGGMAEYMTTPARSLVALDGVDMEQASALTDAGLTACHAVSLARDLLSATSNGLVIGIGGLGHLGLQIAAVTTGATVLAADVDPGRLDLARELGATHAFLSGPDTAAAVRGITGPAGVDVVFDFVGGPDTTELATKVVGPGGAIVVTGLGGGALGMSFALGGPAVALTGAAVPGEVRVIRSFAGGIDDLRTCLSLARRGLLTVLTTTYPLERAGEAFDALVAGEVVGRAVVVP
jgi:alcohol dehydrogenase, propanol-preferring